MTYSSALVNFWKKKPEESSEVNEIDGLINKGMAVFKVGKYEQAIAFFDDVLKIEPSNFYASYNKGLVLFQLCKYKEALFFYDESLKIKPKNVLAMTNKGLVLFTLGRHEQAMTCYDKALEIEPENVYTLDQKGDALSILGKYEEAIVFYDKALKIDPRYVFSLHSKGLALSDLGKHDQAKECYDEISKIAPNYKNFLKKRVTMNSTTIKEPLGNGMIFRFKIRPRVFEEERSNGLLYITNEGGMLEHFDDPKGKYEDEQDKTILTIEFWKSKFYAPVDDPSYKKFNEQYIKWVLNVFKQSRYSCELLESGVLIDMPNGMKFALYNFDDKLTPKE